MGEITDEIRLEHFKRFDKQKSIFERVLYKLFLKALNKVCFDAIDRNTVQYITEKELFDAYLDAYAIIFRKHGAKAVKTINLKREAPPLSIGFFSAQFRAKVKEYLFNTAATRITNVNENTKKQVRQILEANKFTGARKTAGKLKKEIGVINKNRALLIARTESLTAMNYVSHTSAIQQGVTSKAWLHTIGKSKDFREEHLVINEKPIPIKDKFIVNGLSMEYPGDPNGGAINNCNCRCSVIYGYDKATKPNHSNLFTNFMAGLVLGVLVRP